MSAINQSPNNGPISTDHLQQASSTTSTNDPASQKTQKYLKEHNRMPQTTATSPSASNKQYSFSNLSQFLGSLPSKIYNWVMTRMGYLPKQEPTDLGNKTQTVDTYVAQTTGGSVTEVPHYNESEGKSVNSEATTVVPQYQNPHAKKTDQQPVVPSKGVQERLDTISKKINDLDKGSPSQEAKTSIAVLHFAQDLLTSLAPNPKEQQDAEKILGISINPFSEGDPVSSLANEFSSIEGSSWETVLDTIDQVQKQGGCFPNTRQINDTTKFDLSLKVLENLQNNPSASAEKKQSVTDSIISQKAFLANPATAFPFIFKNLPRDEQTNVLENLIQKSPALSDKEMQKMCASFSKEDTSFLLSTLHNMKDKPKTPFTSSLVLTATEHLISLHLDEGSLPPILENNSPERSQLLKYISHNPASDSEPLCDLLRSEIGAAPLADETNKALFSLLLDIGKLSQTDTAEEIFTNLVGPVENKLREQAKQEVIAKLTNRSNERVSNKENSTVSEQISTRIDELLEGLTPPQEKDVKAKEIEPIFQTKISNLTSRMAKIDSDIRDKKNQKESLEKMITATQESLSSKLFKSAEEKESTKLKNEIIANAKKEVEKLTKENTELSQKQTALFRERNTLQAKIQQMEQKSYDLQRDNDPVVKEAISSLIQEKYKNFAISKVNTDPSLSTIIRRAASKEVAPEVSAKLENILISKEWQAAATKKLDNKDESASNYLKYIGEKNPDIPNQPENKQLATELGSVTHSFTIDDTAEFEKVQTYLKFPGTRFVANFFDSPLKYSGSMPSNSQFLLDHLVKNKILWSKLLPTVSNIVKDENFVSDIGKNAEDSLAKKIVFLDKVTEEMLSKTHESLASTTGNLSNEDRTFLEKFSYDITKNILKK